MKKKHPFSKATFIKSALEAKFFPKERFDELALVGRSNVGKSSLINHLLFQKDLAKVSATPGKTRLLNFFEIDENLVLVDFPGYGFAKAGQQHVNAWTKGIDQYLETRTSLRLVVLLLDIRRKPNRDDLLFYSWAKHHEKQILIVLTKLDKIKQKEKIKNINTIKQTLEPENPKDLPTMITYSIKDTKYRKILISTINSLLEE